MRGLYHTPEEKWIARDEMRYPRWDGEGGGREVL